MIIRISPARGFWDFDTETLKVVSVHPPFKSLVEMIQLTFDQEQHCWMILDHGQAYKLVSVWQQHLTEAYLAAQDDEVDLLLFKLYGVFNVKDTQ